MVIRTADLLEAWREATRAAELARRLAKAAAAAADQADERSVSSEELAILAERAAQAADEAARTARTFANDAAAKARIARDEGVPDADATIVTTGDEEKVARDAYHRGVDDARKARADGDH